MRHLLTFAAVLALSGPALACVNYTESVKHEREFRSQYQDTQYTPPQPDQASSRELYVMGGAGVLMAVAGAAVLLRQRPQV
jgi:hypothetical protein